MPPPTAAAPANLGWQLFRSFSSPALSTLWLGEPGVGFSTILIVLAGFVAATLAAELMSVFSNAIMTGLVPKDELGRLSGTGWAVGYFGGLASLALVAGLLVPMPGKATTLLGLDPLLKLDAIAHQSDRITGPFAAIWFAVFIIPFFLFVPDRRAAAGVPHPERSAAAELWDTIKSLPSTPSLLIFLIARMLYTDGLTAIFAFGGIYGASVFGWGPLELGIFGIVLTLVGAFGALIGGRLDDRLGPKNRDRLRASDAASPARSAFFRSTRRTSFSRPKLPRRSPVRSRSRPSASRYSWPLPFFVGIVSAPVQAASRSLLARLAPRRQNNAVLRPVRFLRKSDRVSGAVLRRLPDAGNRQSAHRHVGRAGVSLIGVVMMLFVRTRTAPRLTLSAGSGERR